MRTRSMDRSLLNTFNSNRQGRFVLLESFNGYRHYYFYITPNANVGERLAAVRAAWPDHTFETEESDDPLWDWFDTYRQEHLGGA